MSLLLRPIAWREKLQVSKSRNPKTRYREGPQTEIDRLLLRRATVADASRASRNAPAFLDVARQKVLGRDIHDRRGNRRLDDRARNSDDIESRKRQGQRSASVNAVTILMTGVNRRAHNTIAIRNAI
jgi:hypothetical protein